MKRWMMCLSLVVLAGCSSPLPDEYDEFVGQWRNSDTSLLITKGGRIDYTTSKGSTSNSIAMPIKSISEQELVAGFLIFETTFLFAGKPSIKDGLTVLNVDGDDLYKFGDDGKVVFSLTVPSLETIRQLITTDLTGLSDAVVANDFTAFLASTSLQFQSQYSNEKMKEAYQPFMKNEVIIREWMEGEFVLTEEPVINEHAVLIITGKYPTSPNALTFKNRYQYSEGRWKNLGVNVSIDIE